MKQNSNMTDTVNIGTGKGTSVLEIIHIFEKISEQQLNWEFGNRREGDVPEIYADVTKAEQLLDWKANRNVKDAIFDAWNWELKRRNE